MSDDFEHVWRLPGTVKGQDARGDGGRHGPISTSAKARLRRIVNRTPEAVVRLTGRTRGSAGHLKSHLDYITRNGRLQAETQDGRLITDHAGLRALQDDWLLANAAESRGRNTPNATQSVALILSMPPGTPPDRVEDAARSWARGTLGGKYDWVMARHDDTDHAHVHVTVRAVGFDGRRLAPGPADLQQWRERFARELRRLGVEAEATPRQARGTVRKAAPMAVHKAEQRGIEPRVRQAERRDAELEARGPALPQPREWSRDIQMRQESIRGAYLSQAEALMQGDAADRRLAQDIRRFVADMPVPLTRRQALVVELRQVLERHPGRSEPPALPSSSSGVQERQRDKSPPLPDIPHNPPALKEPNR